MAFKMWFHYLPVFESVIYLGGHHEGRKVGYKINSVKSNKIFFKKSTSIITKIFTEE